MRRLLLVTLLLLASPVKADPNIILILADDLSLGGVEAYGQVIGGLGSQFATPGIDALAAAGVRFDNAYIVTPLCQPSRAALYTGKYPFINRQTTNGSDYTGFWTGQTIASLLQDDGYTTAIIGKSHLGQPPVGDPWDHYAVFSSADNGDYWSPAFFEDSTTLETDHLWNGGCVSYDDYADSIFDCYTTDEMTHMATDWIASVKDDAGPFFLLMSERAPHLPLDPPDRYASTIASSAGAQPATYGDDRTGRSAQVVAYTTSIFSNLYTLWIGYSGKEATPGGTDAEKKAWVTEQLQEDYLETMQALDDSVATLRAYLAANSANGETGTLAENTIVIFVSDNGYEAADHGLYGKDAPYRESMRVPLIMAGPGITAGQTKSEIVISVDVTATILDLANVTPPDTTGMVGRTLFDLMPETGAPWRTSALIWSSWSLGDLTPDRTPWYAVVTVNDILVHHYEAQGGITPAWEYIDYSEDSSELANAYGTAANLNRREILRDTVRTLISDAGMPGWTDRRMSSGASGVMP